jgi:hypothetical protein
MSQPAAPEKPGRSGPTWRRNSWGSGYFRMMRGPVSMPSVVGRRSSRHRRVSGRRRGLRPLRTSRSPPAARPPAPSTSGTSHPWGHSPVRRRIRKGCTDPTKVHGRSRPFAPHNHPSRFIVRRRWFAARALTLFGGRRLSYFKFHLINGARAVRGEAGLVMIETISVLLPEPSGGAASPWPGMSMFPEVDAPGYCHPAVPSGRPDRPEAQELGARLSRLAYSGRHGPRPDTVSVS